MAKTPTPADEDQDLGEAGAQLSTAPVEAPETGPTGKLPSMGVIGWARWFWRQLTSMRVALILLFLLSLAAIPGSLVPQTSVDSVKVEDWQKAHPTVTPIYEKLQLFHVYSSVWFSAIYILLFISLIGCIVPRTWQFVGQLRGRPPGAPRRLTRLPAYTTWRTEAEPEEVLAAARKVLRGKRFRTETATGSVAAEKGYLREAGNLLFHISLIVMLVAFATGQLFKAEGSKLIVEGDGFSNTMSQYDDFKPGTLFDQDDLQPFSFDLNGFDSSYERTGPEKGTPRVFRAHVTYYDGVDGKPSKRVVEVNKPLETGGSKVYLQGHGYAPVVTVRDGKGNVAFRGPVASLPVDGKNLTESTILKVPDYRDKDGKKDQIGFQGNFVPTLDLDVVKRTGTMMSQFPALDSPALVLTAYHGSLGLDSGLPQSVYKLDTSKMKQFKDKGGKPFADLLRVGDTMTLPNGAGTLKFDAIKTWATFQVSHQPGNGTALAGAVGALLGLAGSLFIQRRRVWVRAVEGEDGRTVVELGGLGRSESAKLPEELGDLALALQPHAMPVPEPDPGTDPSDPADPADPSEGARA
ncbi:cytochrome c biogenesis protein ResB [Streptomyces sp. NPDC050617]|uniref:cytochrome c biogenesis protein ResB n=1 Tax=Streptomyces sp. NPDC050617 TaxID=3154628 RepID=UPI0034167FFB